MNETDRKPWLLPPSSSLLSCVWICMGRRKGVQGETGRSPSCSLLFLLNTSRAREFHICLYGGIPQPEQSMERGKGEQILPGKERDIIAQFLPSFIGKSKRVRAILLSLQMSHVKFSVSGQRRGSHFPGGLL